MRMINSIELMLVRIWAILLLLCLLIGAFIVPIPGDLMSPFLNFVISSGKVFVSFVLILLWLIYWYKAMNKLLIDELAHGGQSLQSSADSNTV